MSPWSESGKLDCTMFTDEVSMTPIPRPSSSSPGTELRTPESVRTSASSRPSPAVAARKPAMTSRRCGCRLANRSAPADDSRMPAMAGMSVSPVRMAL